MPLPYKRYDFIKRNVIDEARIAIAPDASEMPAFSAIRSSPGYSKNRESDMMSFCLGRDVIRVLMLRKSHRPAFRSDSFTCNSSVLLAKLHFRALHDAPGAVGYC